MVFFVLILLGVHNTSFIYGLMSLVSFGKFSVIISVRITSVHLLFPLQDSNYMCVGPVCHVPFCLIYLPPHPCSIFSIYFFLSILSIQIFSSDL